LQNLIYRNKAFVPNDTIPMIEKVRLLMCIARTLSELHAIGIVHGDLKPDNILLSGDCPMETRLADFGFSRFLNNNSNNNNSSSLVNTKHAKGTPIFCAPEQLHNPFNTSYCDDKVAKASRKTDLYAFAILSWQLLTQQRPFPRTQNAVALASKVHAGERPPVELIPLDCPPSVVQMIQLCWKAQRSERLKAVACFNILQSAYDTLLQAEVPCDVYISTDDSTLSLAQSICRILVEMGFQVIVGETTLSRSFGGRASEHLLASNGDMEYSSNVFATQSARSPYNPQQIGLATCKLFLLLASRRYQQSAVCMGQLQFVQSCQYPPHIVPFFTDPQCRIWCNDEIKSLFQLGGYQSLQYDISAFAHNKVENANIPFDRRTWELLYENVRNLAEFLVSVEIHPHNNLEH
jgi:serine/threonine protein kinase